MNLGIYELKYDSSKVVDYYEIEHKFYEEIYEFCEDGKKSLFYDLCKTYRLENEK